ncbi:MAG: hypothetical protein HYU66_15170 [Armatimonadetes bacterium]|nr:hypothetical protein [Armatimonadota bacterium]
MRRTLLLAAGLLAIGPLWAAVLAEEDFEQGMEGWQPFNETCKATVQQETVHQGAALRLDYALAPGSAMGVMHPVELPPIGMRSIHFWARPSADTVLFVVLGEEDGSSYRTLLRLPANEWTDVHTSLDRFRLGDDSSDENGRLDPDEVRTFGLADLSMFVAPPNAPEARQLYLDDWSLLTDDAPNAYSANGKLPFMLDNFTAPFLSWIPLGAKVSLDAAEHALLWDYNEPAQAGGMAMCATVASIGALPNQGAKHLLITLRAQRATKLAVVLQEEKRGKQDESRYVAMLDVPGAGDYQTQTIALSELQLDTNNGAGDENHKLDLDQVSTLILGDVEVFMGQAPGPNKVWIKEITLTAD